MLAKLVSFFDNECAGICVEPILVGVSGGPDSLCLLDGLVRAQKKVIVAHFNHQLRPEAEQEARHVSKLAARYGLPFVSESQDVRAFAMENKFSIEEAARKLRYRFLFSQARNYGAQVIAVAHNADDQVETVLMHFLRGAGLSGLKGMAPITRLPEFDPDIRLIRPLLQTWRKDIDEYCRENHLETVQDKTNLDQTYFRNRLRHSLIPEMETYNPGFKQALSRSAESLTGDFQLVNDAVDRFWESSLGEIGEGYLTFTLEALQTSNPAMLRNLFRRAATHLNPAVRDVNFEAVERVVRFVKAGYAVSTKVDFIDDLFVFGEGNRLFIANRYANIPVLDWPQVKQPANLEVGVPVLLGGDWSLLVDENEGIKDLVGIASNNDPFQAWMDVELILGNLHVRGRKEGDRFQPLGMPEGSLKLSDFFINEKMPSRRRAFWPLVCMGDEILWIPGYRSAHPYRITGSTRRILHFELSKISFQ
ncbi:MAG: tRNA lysidine(34) synthetase TilS [Chloroflexi bacterium GWB2_49_20]|nr:MAG: tRNA lysidine(34) synthetase TilS [Chloroflexi bacterium GWB2_49_20]OGN77660.1 MAG: tRNA lysidine(34) synthetase TilS [Chloroflexi bacterium GWC2_49_37]OGN86436.1 MAG: tRNA lysidine(34) synthetase TilS [Chloroflexi bacterium GWD2_49_16]